MEALVKVQLTVMEMGFFILAKIMKTLNIFGGCGWNGHGDEVPFGNGAQNISIHHVICSYMYVYLNLQIKIISNYLGADISRIACRILLFLSNFVEKSRYEYS